jgi:acetylornithine deacetylase
VSGSRNADVFALLRELVRTPSPSGEEARVAALLAGWGLSRGLDVAADDVAVRITVVGRHDGPTLLFASHLDTVPPGGGWSVEPYAGVEHDGRLIARGAVDAKASVAAMAAAAAMLRAGGGPAVGRLVVLATFNEETRDTTMPEALRRLGALPDAAVVGEPTGLEPCIAQRGQLLLRLVWQGEQVHAGWAADRDPQPVNAIERAAHDLARLGELKLDRRHPSLGRVAVTPTMLHAGVARNMTPARCEAVLDVRSTPAYCHVELTAAIRAHVRGAVEVLSDRLVPAQTPPDSRLLAALLAVRPAARPWPSPTCSDWVFLRDTDAVKLGPGESKRSHTADEAIELAEVEAAVALYAELAQEYLK